MPNDDLVVPLRQRLQKGTVAIESEEWDAPNLVLHAYFPVLGRVNVQSAECDLIPQTRRHTLFEQLLYFTVVSIPCCPKVDHGKTMRRNENGKRLVRQIGHSL